MACVERQRVGLEGWLTLHYHKECCKRARLTEEFCLGVGAGGYVNNKAASWSLSFRNAYRGFLAFGLGTGNRDSPCWGQEKVMDETREGQLLSTLASIVKMRATEASVSYSPSKIQGDKSLAHGT